MPNITIQVSDELYQHVRLSAARPNMPAGKADRLASPCHGQYDNVLK